MSSPEQLPPNVTDAGPDDRPSEGRDWRDWLDEAAKHIALAQAVEIRTHKQSWRIDLEDVRFANWQRLHHIGEAIDALNQAEELL